MHNTLSYIVLFIKKINLSLKLSTSLPVYVYWSTGWACKNKTSLLFSLGIPINKYLLCYLALTLSSKTTPWYHLTAPQLGNTALADYLNSRTLRQDSSVNSFCVLDLFSSRPEITFVGRVRSARRCTSALEDASRSSSTTARPSWPPSRPDHTLEKYQYSTWALQVSWGVFKTSYTLGVVRHSMYLTWTFVLLKTLLVRLLELMCLICMQS